MGSQWQSLPLRATSSSVPPLFVKHRFGTSVYTVFLSDLTYIWTESLDRRQIIKRAFDQDTSIDPSEGSDQLSLLLQHIQNALEGKAGTSLAILPGLERGSLIVRASSTLPAPLSSLCWPLHLSQSAQGLLRTELLLPCLARLSQARLEVSSLLGHLKDKDHVISRLIDKMQASGMELNAVFPTSAPAKMSKANIRDSLTKSVKGLKAFDEMTWRRSLPNTALEEPIDFREIGEPSIPSSTFINEQAEENWWVQFDFAPRNLSKESIASHSGQPASIDEDDVLNEPDFQVAQCNH